MAFRIQLRRDLALKWTDNNPVLLLGEFGYEYDTGYAKIGDGQTPWVDLDYFVGGTGAFGSETFIGLSDTPNSYTGYKEYYIRINPNGTALEFVPIATINELIDVRGATGFEPGDAGMYLRVNAGGTGFEWATISGGTGGGSYLNPNLTLTGVGGINSGSSFENVVLDKMWNALLHPEEEPSFHSLAVLPNGGTGPYTILEVGQSLTPTLYFYWDTDNNGDIKPNTVSIYDIDNATLILSGLGVTGSASHTYGSSIKYTEKDSYTWRFSAVGSSEITFSEELTVDWYYPIFTGRSSDVSLTNAQITVLTNRLPQATSNGSYSFDAGDPDEYIYICLPNGGSDYNVSAITVNGLPLVLADSDDSYTSIDSGGFRYDSVSSVNINGESKTYRVYRTKNVISGPVTIDINSTELAAGLRITGILAPMSDSDVYPITDPQYGIDGLRNVDLISERNAIPKERRKLGMLVGVGVTGANGSYYKLINEPGTAGTTASDWELFNSGVVTYTSGNTGPSLTGATGINIEGGERITVELTEDPAGTAKYTVDIPKLISGGTA